MEKKIIETKQELHWHFIYHYLIFLESFVVSHTDEGFKKLLNDLRQYVIDKIDVDGEVIKDIREIAKKLGLNEDGLELYGKYKAKINLTEVKPKSKLILVTAIPKQRKGLQAYPAPAFYPL